jgi:hypothetical protein
LEDLSFCRFSSLATIYVPCFWVICLLFLDGNAYTLDVRRWSQVPCNHVRLSSYASMAKATWGVGERPTLLMFCWSIDVLLS